MKAIHLPKIFPVSFLNRAGKFEVLSSFYFQMEFTQENGKDPSILVSYDASSPSASICSAVLTEVLKYIFFMRQQIPRYKLF